MPPPRKRPDLLAASDKVAGIPPADEPHIEELHIQEPPALAPTPPSAAPQEEEPAPYWRATSLRYRESQIERLNRIRGQMLTEGLIVTQDEIARAALDLWLDIAERDREAALEMLRRQEARERQENPNRKHAKSRHKKRG